MEDPETNDENLAEGNSAEGIDSIHSALQKLWISSGADVLDTEVLRSRIDEQSTLICILKQRADELLIRCQALQKINTELEDKMTDCHKELSEEKQKSETLEKRFNILAANNQAIIAFKDEYKSQNAQLRLQNQQLQSENEALFSKKLQDKEATVQKLAQEIKLLKEKYAQTENDYSEKIAGCKAKLLDQASDHKAKKASLLEKIQAAERIHKNSVDMCNDLKLQLQKNKEEYTKEETSMMETIAVLNKEKDRLLHLSMERGKLIQEKQQELEQLEAKLKEEKRLRTKAEERFKKEAEAVNADAKVKSIQGTLDECKTKYERLIKDFEAYKEHSSSLLIQERELNKKLRHMTG